MKKNKILIAVFAAVIAPASFAGAMDFDGRNSGLDPSSLSEMVINSAPAVKTDEIKPNITPKGFAAASTCKTVELNSSDGAAISRNVSLDAAYTWRVCEDTYVSDSNGNTITVSECHNETTWYNATVQLNIGSRQLHTYEKERIEVCYDFRKQKGYFYMKQSPFEYTYRDKQGEYFYVIDLYPGNRKPQAPEASALELAGFSYDDVKKEFTLKINNNFPGNYSGSKVHIGVELVQDKLFDSSRGTKFYEFGINYYTGNYQITFKESDFPSGKDADDSRGKSKKFFVKWGFKVKGAGFTEDYMEKGKTGTVQVIR